MTKSPITESDSARCGAPLRGILTGLNEAFIVDAVTRDRIVRSEEASRPLIRPFLRGENAQRWRVESEDLWLVNIEFGWTNRNLMLGTKEFDEAAAWQAFSEQHPLLAAHISQFSDDAKKRLDKGQYWWEL